MNSDNFEAVHLLDIQLLGSTASSTIRLTSAGEVVTWKGNTYTPVQMTRGQVDERLVTASGEAPTVSVSIANVDQQMAQLLAYHPFDGSKATLYLTDRQLLNNMRPLDAMILAKGLIRNSMLSDTTLQFDIATVLAQMEKITIPLRVFQTHCNYIFGSQACGVNTAVAPYTISTTVTAATTKHIDVPISILSYAGATDPTTFWGTGTLIMGSGVIALNGRPIQRVESLSPVARIWLRYEMPAIPNAGDAVIVKRGCEKTKQACIDRQGNVNQYGGFEDVPPEVFTPNEKFGEPGIS